MSRYRRNIDFEEMMLKWKMVLVWKKADWDGVEILCWLLT